MPAVASTAPSGVGKVRLDLVDDETSGPSERQIIIAALANDKGSSATGEIAGDVTREVASGRYALSIPVGPRNGKVTLSGTNLVYVSTAGYVGTDEFTYEVAGKGAGAVKDTAVVRITVNEPLRATEPPEEPDEPEETEGPEETGQPEHSGEPGAQDSGSPTQHAAYYADCAAVRAAGAAPIRSGDPGYGRHLDRDGDGVACGGKAGKPHEGGQSGVFYKNCAAVRAVGADPIRRGDPGYGPHLDSDGDGTGCDW
ncbi:excalibur calcium-binding domain-containing protein [Streptomyces sp. NPDC004111]|uniref:excalibur calcium-binding domain-containing protein n=1 Tax=Streptomyces sp. NPDC004111 TaxID=3364690 RepID=UPI0036B473DE